MQNEKPSAYEKNFFLKNRRLPDCYSRGYPQFIAIYSPLQRGFESPCE